jgi:ProP effector
MPDTPLPSDAVPEPTAPPLQEPVVVPADAPVPVPADALVSAQSEDSAEVAAAADASAPAAPPAPELTLSQCAARLAELFPALFAPPVKPIKLRIQADLQVRAPGVFSRKVLSVFLHRHTTSTAYLKSLVALGQRFDLDGQPAGELAPEHREAAVAELARRREVVDARREAERQALRQAQRESEKAQREAYRQAQQEQQAQERQRREAFAAQDGERRERLALLRAFETSTLTRANFCALKRIDEATLEAQLALARQDLAQRAAVPQPEVPHRQERQDSRRQPSADQEQRGPRHGRPPRHRAPGA